MKTTIRMMGMALIGAGIGYSARAATLHWDGDTGTAGPQNAGGTWQTGSGNNWWASGANTTFADGDTVIFGTNTTGTANYNITVSGTVRTPMLIFSNYTAQANARYNLSGGTIDLGTGGTIATIASTTPGLGPVINSSIVATNLTTAGAGYLTWGGANALRGTLTVGNGPRLVINTLGAIQGGDNNLDKIVLNAGKVLYFAASATGTYTMPIEIYGSNAQLSCHGTSNPILNGPITIHNNNSNQINVDFTGVMTVNGAVSGAGGLLFNFAGTGAGVILMTGESSYTGATAIHGNGDDAVVLSGGNNRLPTGTAVSINSINALVLGDTTAAMSQTIASLSGNNAGARVVGANASASTLAFDSKPGVQTTFLGTVGLLGGHANTNNLAVVMGGSGAQILNNANYYTGGTTVNGGTLVFASAGAKPATGGVTVNAGGAIGLGVDSLGFDYWTTDDIDALWANTLAGFTMDANARIGIHTGVENITYGSDLSTRGLIKTGAFALTLTGNNTYTGGTEIYNGTLIVGANALGSGPMVLGGGTLSNTATRTISDSINLSAASTIGAAAGTALTMSGDMAGSGALTTAGGGEIIFNGTHGLSGQTIFDVGTTTLGGALGITNNLFIANAANSKSLVNILPGASLGVYSNSTANFVIQLGRTAGAAGVIRQTGGDVLNERRAEQGLSLGVVAGGYGAYEIFGGTMTAGFISVGQAGNGVLGVYGGVVNLTSYLFASRAAGGTGIVDVAGGTLDGSAMANQFAVGNWASSATALGVMNVRDGGVLKIKSGVQLQIGKSAGATGIVNLMAGGTAEVWQINNDAATANAYLNFNGGVLKPVANAVNFITTSLDGVYIHNGGAIIDDNGFAIGIPASLLAPDGQGVSGITLGDGGSGYIAPPIVAIAGGSGFGATAIAQIDYATGIITNILVTNPGSGYQAADSLTVVLSGGGGTGAAISGSSLSANVGGSLTKLGGGVLTLSGVNTYSGGTTVNGGTLVFAAKGAKPATGDVTINAGGAIGLGVDTAGVDYWTTGNIDALWANSLAGFAMDDDARVGIHTGVEDITYGSDLSTRGLIKTGAFALTLTGNNTYAGGTEIHNGTLIVAGNSTLGGGLVLRGGILSNAANSSISGAINVATASTIGTAAGTTLTISGTVTNTGALTKSGQGTLEITGAMTHQGATVFNEGTINVGATGSLRTGWDITVGNVPNVDAVMNIQGGSVSGRTFFVGLGAAGRTGIVNQTTGSLDLSGQNGLLLGNGGSVGIFNLSGGTVNANVDMGAAGLGVTLGVNAGSTGIVNVAGGVLNSRQLEVGRNGVFDRAVGVFTQSDGTTTIGSLLIGASENARSEFTLSGGTFTATNFTALAQRPGGTGILHFAQGALVNLGAFPTARGANSYAEATFDGAVIRPIAASGGYMSGLHKAFVTERGAIFEVATGNDITIAQSFENAAGEAGVLNKRGAGVLVLSGANNTFTGVTTVEGGTLRVTSQGAAGLTPLIVVSNGATYQVNPAFGAPVTITNSVRLAGSTAQLQSWQNNMEFNYTGEITLDGGGRISTFNAGVTTNIIEQGITGTGDLTLAATAANNGRGEFVLRGQSTYSGNTILTTANATNNHVRIETDNALPVGTVLTVRTGGAAAGLIEAGGSKFALNGYNQEVAGITSIAQYAGQTNYIVGGGAALSILTVNNAANHAFDGRIGGGEANEDNLALVKKGAGTLTLGFDNNTYTGATTIEGGTLAINGTHSGGGLITVKTGGILGGGGTVGGVKVESGGFINPGNSAGELTVDTLTLDGGSTLQFELGASDVDPSDLLNVTTLSKGSGTGWTLDFMNSGYIGDFTLVNYGSTDFVAGDFTTTGLADGLSVGSLTVGSNVIELTVIPEPASLGTLGILALAGLLRRRLRR